MALFVEAPDAVSFRSGNVLGKLASIKDSIRLKLLLPTSLAVVVLVVVVGFYTPSQVINAALDEAVTKSLQTADQMRTLRAFYSARVVAKAVKGGAKASPTYADDPTAIPVPTTFILDVAKAFSNDQVKVGLVSPYPWPMRAGRALDDFQRQAWSELSTNPEARVVRREVVDGREMLRVAVGDRMDASCVACHNTNPLSPKRDWKVGDVRGIIEIDRPINQITQQARNLSWQVVMFIGVAGLGLFAVLSGIGLRVVRPLNDLTSVIHRIARGVLHEHVPHTERSDELGTFARAVRNLQDLTDQRVKSEAQIAHMAHHDSLTGLPNRVSFAAELEYALAMRQPDEDIAVFCLDLDRFKAVNDTLGHPVGDALLQAVAERLQSCVVAPSMVARLGGDEFAIVQIGGRQPDDAGLLAEYIISILSMPYDIDGYQIIIGASIGVSLAPHDGSEAEELLRDADLALYRSKAEGRSVYRFFEPEMDALMQARRELELDLRCALTNGELELYYQPLINIGDGQICGFEALIRWHHPTRGMVPPAEFIPLAEEVGEIDAIGAWVLRAACHEASRWPSHLKVAVNLSPKQFKNNVLILHVIAALLESGLQPKRLELEITESIMLQDSESNILTLTQLQELGVRIAMDDFGTGYSSLSYLRRFPFDKIKIDRSFVKDLADGDESMAIIRAVMDLGHGLGMSTTAEGVETEGQLERLRAEGCVEAQGYLISPPIPAGSVLQLLELHDEQSLLTA